MWLEVVTRGIKTAQLCQFAFVDKGKYVEIFPWLITDNSILFFLLYFLIVNVTKRTINNCLQWNSQFQNLCFSKNLLHFTINGSKKFNAIIHKFVPVPYTFK